MNLFHSIPFALLVALAGCAAVPEPSTGFQYAKDVGSKDALATGKGNGEVTVVWRYGSASWVSAMCGGRPGETNVHGCAMRDAGSDRCVMFLVEPKDFQDRERLAVVGHEFWHCTGARHT